MQLDRSTKERLRAVERASGERLAQTSVQARSAGAADWWAGLEIEAPGR
jgi:hypothetical protein